MRDNALAKRIAAERVAVLVGLSSKALHAGDSEHSRRYSRLASELVTHYRLKGALRGLVCRSCKSLLEPGITCDVRLASPGRQVIYRCRLCGREARRPYRAAPRLK